jgi:hypothetical protein
MGDEDNTPRDFFLLRGHEAELLGCRVLGAQAVVCGTRF